MAELNRLQQNFPYGDDKHFMYVAVSQETKDIVGFCDVDARPAKIANAPPRPYLSDLTVDPNWRRKGIASALVFGSEATALQIMGHTQLFIRVEEENKPALQMYNALQYDAQDHPFFGVKDTTTLLRRDLLQSRKEAVKDASTEDSESDSIPAENFSI
eukprot:scaffold5013_cov51-Attheya_sp.AAC.1